MNHVPATDPFAAIALADHAPAMDAAARADVADDAGRPHYCPGLEVLIRGAWETYRAAWHAEDLASERCPVVHVHADGERIERQGLCPDEDSAGGRAHRAAQVTLARARAVHDGLMELKRREDDGRAARDRMARDHAIAAPAAELAARAAATRERIAAARAARTQVDDLTALAHSVFADADDALHLARAAELDATTVGGLTVAEQKRRDAIAPRGGHRS